MKPKLKRARRRQGDLLKIELGKGLRSYAQVGPHPIIIFFDGAFSQNLPNHEVLRLPVLFRIPVMHRAITSGDWPTIGRGELSPENATEPLFFKIDAITGQFFLYHSSFAATNYERPALASQCEGLECAAVWSAEHVLTRLQDHFAGRPDHSTFAHELEKLNRSRSA
jgi:hypothetical protein